MSEKNLEIVREYNFDPKEVIKGLNGYYEPDKCNSYITIRRNDVEGPAYLSTPIYLSALIEWLREDHDIFYRPGMTLDQVEAARSAAKMCGLRAHIKDEICKRGLWCGADEDVPELVDTLFKAYDEEGERADENRKEVVKLSKENRELKEGVCEYIMKYIRQEATRNGFELPDEIDGEPLTIKRVFHDLLELLRKRTSEIKEVNDKRWKDLRGINKALGYDGMNGHVDDFAKAVKARAECAKMALGEESDVNALIRDYCTKNDIIAPSRYFSDKACVEYLFSVIDLKQKDRSFAILQDLYRDIFKKQPNGLSAEDIANKILDRMLETEDLLHKSVDSVNKECKATGKLMVADYEKDLLQFIYKEYKGRIHLSDETITYNPPSVRNTVLKIISDYARCRTRNDILETRIKSIFDRCKTKFTVDDYVLNGDPTSKFMLDCISSWISSPAESRGKTRAEIENYKLKLKDYILNDIKKHGYRYDGLETKSIEEIVDRIIEIAACSRNEWAKDEIKKLRGQIDSLKSLINAVNEEVKDM